MIMHQNNTKIAFFYNNPLWLALFIQLGVFIAIWLSLPYVAYWIIPPYNPLSWLLVQVVLVVAVSYALKMPYWWLWIQALLPIGLFVGLSQQLIPVVWFGVIALFLMLVFSNVWSERVPLYLSNRITHRALGQLVRERNIKIAVDLGSGLGGVVRALAKQGVDATGVEFSPILAVLSAALCRWFGLGRVLRGDMWQQDLSHYDLVYVFLSPVPMSALWQKTQREMKTGSVFVSNSFAVPDHEPDDVWELADGRQTLLFIYVMK
jgi:uncharacterized membrane protein